MTKWRKSSLGRLCSCLVLLSASSWQARSSEPAIQPPSNAWSAEFDRLAEISRRLAALNETLSSELNDSRKSSEELARSLESSRLELSVLREELEASRTISNELASSAERSERESLELREALLKAESSLRSLETSFADYRKEAEARIARLERKGGVVRLVATAASVLAASGWAAFLLALAF